MTKVAIRMEGLTRDFGSVRAVNNLSLEVPSRIIFGFLGPNEGEQILLIVVAILAVIDVVVFVALMSRFQRSRMYLD